MKDAAAFWDQQAIHNTHISWMADQQVRFYINESISGDKHLWPMDWLARDHGPVAFDRALSIGCGTGTLERDLIKRGFAKRFDAVDGSPISIEVAMRDAAAAGYGDRIQYRVGDFNEPDFPANTYDAVFFHQSAHHVSKLEKLFRAVRRSMKAGGMLYLDDFFGPSRTDWDDQLLAPVRALHKRIPDELRVRDFLPLPILYEDPSEAVRSSEILPQLRIGFEIADVRGYGGNLLSLLYEELRNHPPEVVKYLIDAERDLLAKGEPPFCAIVIARPKQGVAGSLASARYFLEPKLKRVIREAKRIMSRP